MTKLKKCPFCNKMPREYWDIPSRKEGYNITCCIVHISCADKEAACEYWNTRYNQPEPCTCSRCTGFPDPEDFYDED